MTTPFFGPPGNLDELDGPALVGWSELITMHMEGFSKNHRRFFNPAADTAPAQPQVVSVVWAASPARLTHEHTDLERWEKADESRDEQDEYCEWRVQRDGDGKLTAIEFSTETPDYWAHLAEVDASRLVELYRELVDPEVLEDDLFVPDSRMGRRYNPNNRWNDASSAGIAHLRQRNNNLHAAIALVAQATVQWTKGGRRVSDRRELVACGGLGDGLRNSDPQIADIINDAVSAGSAVSLANPLGLYMEPPQTHGFQTPDGTDPATFWTPVRGTSGHVVRARFAVPNGLGYVLGDLTANGMPLQFGAQVADQLLVRADALTVQSDADLETSVCGS